MTSDDEHLDGLDVVERRDPPDSKINDSIVVLTSMGAAAFAILFAVTVRVGGPIQLYGGALAASLMLLAVAIRRYFSGRYPDVTAVEPRTPFGEPDEPERVSDVEPVGPRRKFLTRALGAAVGLVGLSLLALVPSLGPSPGNTLRRTRWGRGIRLVTGDGQPVRPGEVAAGGIASIWPENGINHERSSVLLVRLQQPAKPPTNPDWIVEDLVAYSKVCTHAGCAVALYRAPHFEPTRPRPALVCPCHYSTFDPATGGTVLFGPAGRPLPQLPLEIDAAGNLRAAGNFSGPVGPAWWGTRSREVENP